MAPRAKNALWVAVILLLYAFYRIFYIGFVTASELCNHENGIFHNSLWACTKFIWALITTGFPVLTAAVCIHFAIIAVYPVSKFHTWLSLIAQYFFMFISLPYAVYRMRKLHQQTMFTIEQQEELLRKHLKRCSATQYGFNHNMAKINSREEFAKHHPLTDYSHYKNYIERTMKGEENVMIVERPYMIGVTSSTSGGKSKTIPVTTDYMKTIINTVVPAINYVTFRYFPESLNFSKGLRLYFTPIYRYTEAGIVMGPVSSPKPTKLLDLMLFACFTTPLPAYEITNEENLTYIHLLFALADKNTCSIDAAFVSKVYSAGKTLERKWNQFVQDIRTGRIDPTLPIDDGLKWRLNEHLTADESRADEIAFECSLGFDGIFKKLWPHCSFVRAVIGGSFQMYAQKLQASYAKGIPYFPSNYYSTEGVIGVCLWPFDYTPVYQLLTDTIFYEFIPAESSDEQNPKTLFIDQVELGNIYELVLTTSSGLFRYRMGDAVKIVRFINQCPVVEVCYRIGQLLNVKGEKTSEHSMYTALQKTAAKWGVVIKDYTCCESILSQSSTDMDDLPYYIVFVELDAEKSETLPNKDREMLDRQLMEESYPYESFRVKNAIKKAQVHVVRPGTFDEFRNFILESTMAAANQLKIPRCLKRKDFYDYFTKRILR